MSMHAASMLLLADAFLERYRSALESIADHGDHGRGCGGWLGPDGEEWMDESACDCGVHVARVALGRVGRRGSDDV